MWRPNPHSAVWPGAHPGSGGETPRISSTEENRGDAGHAAPSCWQSPSARAVPGNPRRGNCPSLPTRAPVTAVRARRGAAPRRGPGAGPVARRGLPGTVHSLPAEEAARAYPVHLQAVVTYYDPYIDVRHGALFVQDSTGAVFVSLPD